MYKMSAAFILNRVLPLSRLAKPVTNASIICKDIHTASYPLAFKATPCLQAAPLKKKVRIDVAIIKARIDKKKGKIEKMIRKLRKAQRHLKPIEEIEEPEWLEEEKSLRTRGVEVPESVEEERIHLTKRWCAYKNREMYKDSQMLDRLVYSQQRALDELKMESEELYRAAIELDQNLLQFKFGGPSENPPIQNYEAPDGEYTNLSRDWSKEVEI